MCRSLLSRVARKPIIGFLTRLGISRAVQPQKMARGLNFRIWEEEGLYYICIKHKHPTVDLHLCFLICKKQVLIMWLDLRVLYFRLSFSTTVHIGMYQYGCCIDIDMSVA